LVTLNYLLGKGYVNAERDRESRQTTNPTMYFNFRARLLSVGAVRSPAGDAASRRL
jgi:hypothetical protein